MIEDNLNISDDIHESMLNVVKCYQDMDYKRARGKGLGYIVGALMASYQFSYHPFPQYIEDAEQAREAMENNQQIDNIRQKLNDFMQRVVTEEEKKCEVLIDLSDTGMKSDEVIADLKMCECDKYDYLDKLMECNGLGDGNLCDAVRPYYADMFHDMGCDVYDDLRKLNGVGDVHQGLLPTSKYYADDVTEQQRLLQKMDDDIYALTNLHGNRFVDMENVLYNYMQLSDKAVMNGLDTVDKNDVMNVIYCGYSNENGKEVKKGHYPFSAEMLQFMRDYNESLFDSHFAEATIIRKDTIESTNKDIMLGFQLQPDGSFQQMHMNLNYGSHTFTDVECGDLFMNRAITIPDFVTKNGTSKTLTGSLMKQSYNGHEFIGFQPIQYSSEKVMDSGLDNTKRIADYKKLVDVCKSENRVVTKDEYQCFANDAGIGGSNYSAMDLKQMRDYDTAFFDKNMSDLTIQSVGISEKTGKYVAKGMHLQSDGSFKPIQMNATFGNHKFELSDIGKMLTGQTVEISGFQSRAGVVQDIQGKLERQEYKGRAFYGFQRTFSDAERQSQRQQSLNTKYGDMCTEPSGAGTQYN